MLELGILFGLLVVPSLVLICVLVRRHRGSTENAEGLRIEQARLMQTQYDKAIYRAGTVDGRASPTRDHHRP